MALTIVRNDITRMQVDAIVNTTNEYFEVGGLGVDAGIHYAAGPKLKEALSAIGYCPVGSAVITEAFDISCCRYIIHTVGPIYVDGHHGERGQLESCYRSILALARDRGCRSVAIPSISTGAYGYPKAEAYSIATSCIREFLLSLPDDEDMMVYMVLYDSESVAVSEKIDAGVEQFISDTYRQLRKEELYSAYKENRPPVQSVRKPQAFRPLPSSSPRERRRRAKPPHEEGSILEDAAASFSLASESGLPDLAPCAPLPNFNEPELAAAPSLSFESAAKVGSFAAAAAHLPGEGYEKEDRSFADMCEWWCTEKGLSKKEFYNRANINRSMFWGMKHHPEQIPKKTNALACVIGLGLDYVQAIDLLRRAGMTLSKYYETDRIVEYFIREKNYNIDEINYLLYKKDLALLGTY